MLKALALLVALSAAIPAQTSTPAIPAIPFPAISGGALLPLMPIVGGEGGVINLPKVIVASWLVAASPGGDPGAIVLSLNEGGGLELGYVSPNGYSTTNWGEATGEQGPISPMGTESMIVSIGGTPRPPVFTTSWTNVRGRDQEVKTDCAGMALSRCVRQHAASVAAFEVAFPPAPQPKDG